MTQKSCRASLALLVAAAAFFTGCGRKTNSLQPQNPIPAEQQSANAAGFKEFSDRVDDYVRLHDAQEALLPKLKKQTELPEMIAAHQVALERKIRQARASAKVGDIFTPAAVKSFQDVIQSTMQGAHGPNVDATLKQGAPLPISSVALNAPYPDGVPYTSVPPTLLLVFPKLPDEVVYRVVLHDLLLLDLKANLVVDVIPGIIP